MSRRARTLALEIESRPYKTPFRITGKTSTHCDILVVRIAEDGLVGEGEAFGVPYRGESAATLAAEIEVQRGLIEAGLERDELARVLPAGGARNALDCALWDLAARRHSTPVWDLAGLAAPRPLATSFTCSADTPAAMADAARGFAAARILKLKLTGARADGERVRAVRAARPDAELLVDANQGFSRAALAALMPVLVEAGVTLIEQPFPVGAEALFDGLVSPIALCADESVQTTADLAALVGRVAAVNIKLDKCGGLSAALDMVREARRLGFAPLVGCMGGTSLAMAPAFLVGQLADRVDLDGPALLVADRAPAARYAGGTIAFPPGGWGSGRAR